MEYLPDLPDVLITFGQAVLGMSLVVYCLILFSIPVYSRKCYNHAMRITSMLGGAVMLYTLFTEDTGRGWAVWLIGLFMVSLIASTLSVKTRMTRNTRYDD